MYFENRRKNIRNRKIMLCCIGSIVFLLILVIYFCTHKTETESTTHEFLHKEYSCARFEYHDELRYD